MARVQVSRGGPPEPVHDELGCFFISVAARILGVHPQTLRYYERAGLIRPTRSQGNIRLYSTRDLEQAQLIKRWIEEFGVNLAGVEVMLRMRARIDELQHELEELRAEVTRPRP